MVSTLGLSSADLDLLRRHLEAAYPSEGCGVVYTGGAAVRVVPMKNAADRYHALDPAAYPRTSRTAYLFEPKEWLQTEQAAEDAGERLLCIVHSHADVGAYFSEEDRRQAAPDGEPLYPGVLYLVVAVDGGRAGGSKLFRWEGGEWHESAGPDFSLPK